MPDNQPNTEDVMTVLLPKLARNHNIDLPKEYGTWHPVSADILGAISKGLESEAANNLVNSIPDIWARLLLFEMALFDENHGLHKMVLGEWRGLLAVLALRDIHQLSEITATEIDITGTPTEKNEIWHSSVKKLVPVGSPYESTTWERLHIFLEHDKPFAITSPTTLVATSTSYAALVLPPAKVRWFKNRFVDPTTVELSKIERTHLAAWLKMLHNRVMDHPIHPTDEARSKHGRLLSLLQGYLEALDVADPPVFTPAVAGFNIGGASIFRYLDRPISYNEKNDSNVQLVSSYKKTPIRPLLLVDHSIGEQWGVRDKSDVSIYGPLTLANIPFEGLVPNQHNRIGVTDITDADVWIPEELLTPKLYYVLASDAFPGSHSLGGKWANGRIPSINKQPISIILPIKKELLDHLSNDDLLRNLVLIQGNDGEVTVKLGVHLSGLDGQGRLYEIEKTYARADMVDLSQVPILEIFPNFRSDSWSTYYVAYAADNLTSTFQVRPFPEQGTVTVIPDPKNQNGKRWISVLEDLPEAFICSFQEQSGPGTNKGLAEIGVLLLPKAENETPPQTRPYSVGVDFGASGTMVYYSTDAEKEPLSFKNRKYSVTNISDTQSAEVLKFFLPQNDVNPSFLTLYQDFANRGPDPQRAFTNGHIYYFAGALDLSDPNIFSNLKWSGENEGASRVQSFLSQVSIQCSAELAMMGASTIDWRFSYPTAFSDEQTNNLQAIWTQILADTSRQAGIPTTGPNCLAESVASAECFQNGGASIAGIQASTTTGAVFIDIGGSTSDISIWQDNTLRLQLSLRFAGRDIFLDYLWKHIGLLKLFNIDTKALEGARSNKEKFWSLADAILRNNSDDIFKAIPKNFENEEFMAFRRHLLIGLSGLFYYVGLSLSHLISQSRYTGYVPHVYLGGNGSLMFRWLSNGMPFEENHSVADLFEKVFTSAIGTQLSGEFKMVASQRPKHESAYGLVCAPRLNTANYEEVVIAGEAFKLNDTVQHWNTELNLRRPSTSIKPPDVFDRLIAFVGSFNEYAGKTGGDLRPIEFNASVADKVRRFVDTNCSDPSVQNVIFITALRGLLDSLK